MLATEGNWSAIGFALLLDMPLTAHNMDCQVVSGVQLALFLTCVELETTRNLYRFRIVLEGRIQRQLGSVGGPDR
jgi:hypothetical protein